MTDRQPHNLVFYKLENSPGWLPADLFGDIDSAKRFCEKNKEISNWYAYEIFPDGEWKFNGVIFQETVLNPYDMHLTTNYIYSTDLKKWFIHENEFIPLPKRNCEETDEFIIQTRFTHDFNNFEDITEGEFYLSPIVTVKFKSEKQTTSSLIDLYKFKKLYCRFIFNVKRNNFSTLIIDEFSYHKFLVWNLGNKVRFIIQDYCGWGNVEILFDAIIDKDLFINTVENVARKIAKKDKILVNKMYKIYKNKFNKNFKPKY